ncbi:MAG: imidazole glycerol phosphate synthase subunit HisF [Fimbriimonas sp.]|nr:imidazole glycerol phosphate synthase subunit HisF [Fimbriimonas sp.]
MVTKRIIPCLDCRDGRVVKGVNFQGLQDAGSPVELSLRYQEEGADEIVILDVGATVEGRQNQLETIRAVRADLAIPLTVGGGVRELRDIEALLEAGADKVSINTAGVDRPEFIREASEAFGAQCTVVAIDTKWTYNRWSVLTRAGRDVRDIDTLEWCRQVAELGAGEILLTSFDRDGTKEGYDLKLLRAASSAVSIPIIASGGARVADDLYDAFEAGANAALAASIFHYDSLHISDIKAHLAQRGVTVRQ